MLTVLGFRRATAEELAAWVRRQDVRAPGWRGLLSGRSAASVNWLVALGGLYATVAAAFVLPRAEELSPRWSGALVATVKARNEKTLRTVSSGRVGAQITLSAGVGLRFAKGSEPSRVAGNLTGASGG